MGDGTHEDPEQRRASIDQSLWVLWQAVQELAAERDALAEEVKSLAARVSALEAADASGEEIAS